MQRLVMDYVDKLRNQYWYIKNVIYILLYMVILQIYYLIASFQEHNGYPFGGPYILVTPIDNVIPFVSAFVIIYVFIFYPFFIFGFGYYMFIEVENSDRFFLSLVIIYAVAYLFYIFFPVIMIRPLPQDLPKDFLSQVMACYYIADPPLNCFPSLHAALSTIVAYHLSRDHKKYSYLFWAIAIGVMVSTLFVRQHVIADEIAGFLLAYFAGWLIDKKVPQSQKKEDYMMVRWIVLLVVGVVFTITSLISYIPPCG